MYMHISIYKRKLPMEEKDKFWKKRYTIIHSKTIISWTLCAITFISSLALELASSLVLL
jgi:hypothetical protein